VSKRRPDPHANEGFLLSLIETHPVKHTPVTAVTDSDLRFVDTWILAHGRLARSGLSGG
jgi:hypothetical protein